MHRQNHRNQINHTPITQPKNKQKILQMSKGLPSKRIIFCSGTLHTMFWMKITVNKQHVLDEDHTAQNNMFWMKITLHRTCTFSMKITLDKTTCFG
jgi:hypothetical protein